MLIEETLFGTVDKVQNSINRLKEYEPPEGYYVCFSGGKDSTVVYDLVKKSGVKYDVHYNVTTIEPPELIDFVKNTYPEVEMTQPPYTMFDLVVKKTFPPTPRFRYCTTNFKTPYGRGRFKVVGVRAEESSRRAKKPIWEIDKNGTKILNVILDWTATDVWKYIHKTKLPYCKLYDEGFTRIGCVLCPFAKKDVIQQDLKKFPSIVQMYRDACNASFERRIKRGNPLKGFQNGEDLFQWWLNCLLQVKTYETKPYEITLFEENDKNEYLSL